MVEWFTRKVEGHYSADEEVLQGVMGGHAVKLFGARNKLQDPCGR